MITNNIKTIRVINKLSQSDLAHLIGCSRQTIYRIEEGISIPSIKMAYEIAHALKQPIKHVFIYVKEKTH